MKDKTEFQKEAWPTCPRCDTELSDDFWYREDVDSGSQISPISVECWECGLRFQYSFEVHKYYCHYSYSESVEDDAEGEL